MPLDEAAVRVMGPVGTSNRRRPLHRSELIDQADCRSDDAAFYSMHSSPNWGRRRVLFTLLLGNTSRHRGVGSLLWSSPHHPIGRTPAQSPSCGGALFSTVDRSCCPKGCGSRLLPPPKRAPTLGNRDPNPTIGFLKSRCGFLWPELWRHCPFSRGIVFW